MLRYVYSKELQAFPKLARTMFRDRADQFKNRLGWNVSVDDKGEERDQYDRLDPLYLIWEMPDGSHGGSMRFLPTTGRVMVNDVFGHMLERGPITSPAIWECTRFCLARSAHSRVAAALMLGGGELMVGFGIHKFVGVFDRRMVRIYRGIGSSPEILGSDGAGREEIHVGLWQFDPTGYQTLVRGAGISPELSQHWYRRAFGSRFPNAIGATA